jgi:type IV pilus assembly protein PilA
MSTFCTGCGNSINADEKFCPACGKAVDAGMDAGTAPAAAVVPSGPAETSGKAIISLIFGLFIFFFPFSIIAVVFGHLSLSEIRKSAGRLKGDGTAMAGLVLGYLGVAFIPIVLIIAAIAIPNLLRARMAANESSAVASIRTINVAELTYSQAKPTTGFTCALPELGQYIGSGLAGGLRNGYRFELTACTSGPEGGANTKYQLMAYPVTVNQTGVRAFCSDESAEIKVDSEGSGPNCLQNGLPLR